MMANRKTSISVAITGDVRDLKRAFGEAESAAQQMSRKLDRIGNTLTLGVTLPLAAMGFKAIEAASNVEQALGGLEAVFGDAAQDVIDYSETTVEQVGLSQRAWAELVTPLGAMLSNAGLSMDETKDKTIELSERAADMAAVFGTDVGEALGAMTAALRGERDPIERFGVTIREADVKARALALGLTDSQGNITQYGKTMATLSLIMEQTEKTAGAFNRESDTTAVKMQQLRGRVEDLAAELGQNLLPIAEDVLGLANDMAEEFGNLDEETQKVIISVGALAAASGPLAKLGSLLVRVGGAATAVAGGLGGIAAAAATIPFAWLITESENAEEAMIKQATAAGLAGGEQAALASGIGPLVAEQLEATNQTRAFDEALVDWREEAHRATEAAEGFHEPLFTLAERYAEVKRQADNVVTSVAAAGQAMVDALNPVSQLRDANDRYEDALARVHDLQGDSEASARDLALAEFELLEAAAGVQAAKDTLGTEWDTGALTAAANAVGITNAELLEMLGLIGALDGARMDVVTVRQPGGGVRSINVDTERGATGGMGVFHDGGVVPGPIGMEQLAVVKGGETILPTHKPGFAASGMGGPSVYIANVYGWDDFVTKVRDAGVDIQRLGL